MVMSILPKSKVCKMTKLERKENHVKRTRKQPNVSNLQLTILMNPKLYHKLGFKILGLYRSYLLEWPINLTFTIPDCWAVFFSLPSNLQRSEFFLFLF